MTGEDYVIGFKSGQRITINVKDGAKFVRSICETAKDGGGKTATWHVDSERTIISIGEIEFVLPANAVVDPASVKRSPIQ
jgi:hypothetical protein